MARVAHNERTILPVDIDIINCLAENAMNVSVVSRQLYMHRNTVWYHIVKIKELTGKDPLNLYDLCDLLSIHKPVIEAEPKRVRCKGCKFAVGHDGIHKTVLCQKRSAYPKQWDEMPFDGFCSYGERRNDEQT